MPINFEITLAGVTVHPKEARRRGGMVATFRVAQPGPPIDDRLSSSFDLPVTLSGGYFADKDAIEVMQARLAMIAEALVEATAPWKRDDAWFAERRLEQATAPSSAA
ncbi:hypothetical protein VPH46_06925 [Sphingomonas sp. MJ1 (PH-R8)]|uniref:hypothetical protein n=1 Tax=Sphingomonas sp. MJ1 (PH-R8) TaxID=3112950 RepID=UPI003A8B9E9A